MPTVLPTADTQGRIAAEGGRKLTGLHVLLMLVAFFGLVAAMNAVMIHYALSTFRGEVVSHPYERGLAYNDTIQEARDQAARGWKVDGTVARAADGKARIEVTARDAAGAALSGLRVHVLLAAPADMKRDEPLELTETGAGVYSGETPARPGAWDFEMSAARDGKVLFQSRNRVTLK